MDVIENAVAFLDILISASVSNMYFSSWASVSILLGYFY